MTVPLTWNAGLSFASASSEVSRRGPSSVSNVSSFTAGLPPFCCTILTVSGTISFLKWPFSIAAIARWWLRSANASCSAREMLDSRAWFSATSPVLR